MIANYSMSFFGAIWNLLKSAWNALKKIFVAIFDFLKNLVNWFKSKYREVILKRPKARPIVMVIREEIEKGNYNTLDVGLKKQPPIVKTFYDEATDEILMDHTEVVEYGTLDSETQKAFGDKDMLILE